MPGAAALRRAGVGEGRIGLAKKRNGPNSTTTSARHPGLDPGSMNTDCGNCPRQCSWMRNHVQHEGGGTTVQHLPETSLPHGGRGLLLIVLPVQKPGDVERVAGGAG